MKGWVSVGQLDRRDEDGWMLGLRLEMANAEAKREGDYEVELGKTRATPPYPKPCVYDLLSLVVSGRSNGVTGSSLLGSVPIPQGEATQACTGCLFTNIPTSHLFLVVSIFCFCGKRRKVSGRRGW